MHDPETRITQSARQTSGNFLTLILVAAYLSCASDVSAVVRTWDGSSSGNWGTSANWTPAGVPVDGDDLIFPAGALNLVNTNNIVDLRLGSITFNGAAGAYSLNGNAITLSNGIVAAHTAGNNGVSLAFITNGAGQTYTVESGGTLDVNAAIVLNGFNLTVNNDFNARLDGQISGAGNLTKGNAGTGTLFLGGAVDNTYTGTTTVDQGTLDLNDSAGATALVPGDLVINNGGVVLISEIGGNQIGDDSDVTVNGSGLFDLNNQDETIASLTLVGGTVDSGTGTLTVNGNVTTLASATTAAINGNLHLGNFTRTFSVADGGAALDLDVNAVVSGGSSGSFPLIFYAGITKAGLGLMRLDGTNTYSGPTTVNDGNVTLGNNQGLGATFALGGSAATTVNSNAVLVLNNAHVTNEVLTLNSVNAAGAFQVDATGDWIGSIVLNTNVVIEASSLLQLGGVISGPGGFTKVGASILRLIGTNANIYLGNTMVNAGILELDVNVNNGAIPGNLVSGDGSGLDTVRLLRGDQVNNGGLVTINTGAVFDLNGFTDIIGGMVMTGGTCQSGAGRVRLNGDLTVNASSAVSTITGGLELFGSTVRSFTIGNGTANPALDVSAIISGSGGITVNNTGPSRVLLSGANTYSGLTTINGGFCSIQNASGLGSTLAGTVLNGCNMAVSAVTVVGEGLTNISPSTLQGTVASGWTGPIVLNAHLNLQVISPGYTLELAGAISGSGGVTVLGAGLGAGLVRFSGASANTYAGNTAVEEGTLELAKVLAIQNSASLLIGDGVGGANVDVVRYTANNGINTTVPIIIDESGRLDLNGFNDTVGPLTILGGDITTGAGTLTMNNNLTATFRGDGNAASIAGNLSLGASTRTFTVTNTPGPGAADLFISAAVSGTGGLVKTGDGLLVLSASNSFSGAITVNDGDLDLQDDFAAGTTAGGVTVNGDATLRLFGNINIGAEALTLNSTATSGSLNSRIVSNSWAGPVTLSVNTVVTVSTGDSLNLLGPISGPGGVTKIGSGHLVYSGVGANTYAGTTTVNQGTLLLTKSVGNGALTNDLVIGDGSGGMNADVVRLVGGTQIGNTASVLINASGLLDLDGSGESVGSLAGNGNVALGAGGGFLNVGFDNSSTTFSGIISGAGNISKGLGTTGTLTLSGDNTYAGSTTVSGGTLLINGSQPQSHVTVGAVGILGGSGTVGNIVNIAGGVVAPGTSPGRLTCSNVVFAGASSDFTVELTGPGAGTGYDQLNVRGTNSLGGGTLNVTAGFGLSNAPAIGDQFVLLNNDGAEAITGTFAGLANGAALSVDSLTYRINYNGGLDANDVVLTVTNVPASDAGLTTVASGNGNGLVDPNECNLINIVISNKTGVAMTGISAALQSYTPNVSVLQSGNSYPDIPANGRRTNATPFQISTTTNFACGTTIQLQLAVQTATHNSFKIPVTLFTGSPGAVQSFNNNVVAAIPDGGTLDSTVNVPGFPGPVGKVTVTLHLTHPQDQDLDVTLESPDGTIMVLSTDNGGTSANYGSSCAARTTFDDSAVTAITAGVAPFVGTFRPEGRLSDFRGKFPGEVTGNWILHVTDDNFNGFSGNLQCWTLNLSEADCVPGSGVCETCPDVTLSGAVGANGPLLQTDRLFRDSSASVCGVSNACPGPFVGDGGNYEAHTFRNGPTDACITVSLSSPSIDADLFSAAYLGTFNPADTCLNYLADSGDSTSFSPAPVVYSFNVAANAVFVVEVNAIFGSAGPYLLSVSGGDCRPVLNVTALPGNNALLDWTTAAVGYGLESTNLLVPGGSPLWPPINTIPVVINGRFNVTNSVTSSNQFYHLRKPLP